MSLAWRFNHQPITLWTRVLTNKYNSIGTIQPTSGSRTWISLAKAWQTCTEASTCSVKDGHHVRFWLDRWIPNNTPLRNTIQGPLNKNDEDLKLTEV